MASISPVSPYTSRQLGGSAELTIGRGGGHKKAVSDIKFTPSRAFKRAPKRKRLADWLEKTVDGFYCQTILGVFLIASLFIVDFWILANGREEHDVIIDSFMMLIFISFIVECVILVLTKETYFNGFFFYMDVIGTLSMILDISWMSEGLGLNSTTSDAQLLRAARSAKIGAKSSRLAKLTKLFKLMEQCFQSKDETDPTKVPPAKAVAKALSGVLSRRVAALVMILVLATPLLQYQQIDNAYEAHVDSFGRFLSLSDTVVSQDDWTTIASDFKNFYVNKDMTPVALSVTQDDGTELYSGNWESEYGYIREDSKIKVSSEIGNVAAVISLGSQLRQESLSNVLIILLVIAALVGFTASFQHAVDQLVVIPLERMMETLKSSANSILRSVQHIAHEKGAEEEGENSLFNEADIDDEVEKILETDMLEAMVAKLARITSLVLPGHEHNYVNESNMDQNTKDWIANEYLHEEKQHTTSHESGSGKKKKTMHSPQTTRATIMRRSLQPKEHSKNQPPPNAEQIHNDRLSKEINTWTFDVEGLNEKDLAFTVRFVFHTFEVIEENDMKEKKLMAFLKKLETGYLKNNTYHNWKHAVDVCHTVFRFVVETQSHMYLTPLETMSLLVSAVAHDVGHPGLSNGFLIKSKHPLAIQHNDQSPLENMHCATLYEIVGQEDYDIFDGLSQNDWRTCRKIMISAILGTDMVHHFPLISKMQVFYEMHGIPLQKSIASGACSVDSAPGMKDPANRWFMIDCFLHAADISNPVKSFDICKKWAYLVVEEFFNQGDLEKSRGDGISPMMDRTTTNIFSMQVGFIEFVVFPLYDALIKTFPTLEVLMRNMIKNNREWTSRRRDELRQDSRMERCDTDKVEKNQQEEEKLKGRLSQLETKVETAIQAVLPMAEKLEDAKQKYEEMLKVVASASTTFGLPEKEISINTIYMGRGRLSSKHMIPEADEDMVGSSTVGDVESGRSSTEGEGPE